MDAINRNKLTKEQLDLIERFQVAYNAVDHYLREQTKSNQSTPFSQMVRDYAARYPHWREQESLRMIGDLRNAVVHQRERSYEYLSVPLLSVVENLERIRDQFISPERVYPRFGKNVTCFNAEDVFSEVLRYISEKEFSQFPIYQQDKFLGLLTENGITRWLAHHSTKVMTLVELDEVTVKDLLIQEERRLNYKFVHRGLIILDAENFFVLNPLLEALLITENGKPNEKLMGIITRWDILSH
jgi:predicted transcriptional regulator